MENSLQQSRSRYFAFVLLLIISIIGLEGTYTPTGIYSDKITDHGYQINGGINFRLDAITQGIVEKQYLDNPF
jgi:hypothetical protein